VAETLTVHESAKQRLAAARMWKDLWVLDFKECYFFCAPQRQRQVSSQTAPATQRLLDMPELYTDQAFILCADFVTELVNTYLPEAQRWVERGRGQDLPAQAWDQVKEQVQEDDNRIFEAIKASNFYSELPKAFYPDIAIGTSALWIDRSHPYKAISCLAVPLRELEINLGPDGEIDDRFVVRYVRNSSVRGVLGDELYGKLPKDLVDENNKRATARTQIVWGFWRKWEHEHDEVWQHVVMVKDQVIHEAEMRGEGSCPLVVCRFNPTADWPWGVGPMLQGLPTFRQIDELERQRTEHGELSLTPPITFPDDSFVAVEQGLEPGMAYPIRPGSETAIKPIYQVPPPEEGAYMYQEKLKNLRKLFYVDYPEQTGDTPPTLGQWLDEMARAQRRIGTPGMSFWREGPRSFFLRFKYLLERAGVILPLKVDGRVVSAMPLNPAQRAAEQQDIATATQYIQIAASGFPEEYRAAVDGTATMQAFAAKMRVLALIKFRPPEQVQQAVQMMSQLAALKQKAGAEPPEGAGAPGPV